MARKKRDDEDARKQVEDEGDGTDWLLAQLVTGRTPDSQQQPPASSEPPAAPAQPEPVASTPAAPDLPLRPPSPRREEELDWFSLAEPPAPDAATRALPVVGEPDALPHTPSADPERPDPSTGVPAEPTPAPGLPAWAPPFAAAPPPAPTERVTRVEPPVGEGAAAAEPPPGPVTPTGPFALRWGSNEPATGDSGRADEPTPPTPPAAAPTPPTPVEAGETGDPFAGFTPPVARSSFTPVSSDAPRHPTTPDSAPRGWDERAAEPSKPAAYDDELWAALNEAEPEPEPEPGRDSDPETRRSDESASTPTAPTHPGVALNLPLTPPAAPPTPIADTGDAPDVDEPATQPAEAGGAEADSPIAKQVAEAGYFWNLTPDPTAADPDADVSSAAATINRLRATSPESESGFEAEGDVEAEPESEPGFEWQPQLQPEPEPEPDFEWRAEPQPEPEPEFEWQPSPESEAESDYSDLPIGHAEPTSESASDSGASDRGEPDREPDREPDDHDPLAAFFGGAVATTPPPAHPTAPITDPFAYLAPLPAATAGIPATPAAAPTTPAAAPTAHPAGAATPARSAYDVAGAARGGGSGGSGTTGSGTPGRRNSPVRVLAWIAGGLAAVLVLAGLFWLGTQLGGGGGAAAPAESPAASATPTPTPEPTAAQPAGVHAWDTLFGGECLEPFAGPWEEEFTVVDCAAPHAAQLVYRGVLPGDAAAPFPGEAELASQMNVLCTATGVINLAAVAGMEDLQVQASYPVTEAQWADGERNYYCFANRAGGEPLTASIAGPGPAA